MKIEQLKPFAGKLVTLQFLEPWHALQYQGTMPDADPQHGGQHICHQAMIVSKDAEGAQNAERFAEPLTTRMLGPVKFELVEVALGWDRGDMTLDHVLLIQAAGPDGSLLELACDPENIAFVGRCLVPGQAPPGATRPPAADSGPRIVLP